MSFTNFDKTMKPLKFEWCFVGYLCVVYGFTVDRVSLYDGEGVEGWRWEAPNGQEFYVIGEWDEPPAIPDELKEYLPEGMRE